uniref:ARAD1D37950p n=1 Tax=Blastobotrys adeninivorans TaxID=409370 RepID=A0A060THE0_BLAAD
MVGNKKDEETERYEDALDDALKTEEVVNTEGHDGANEGGEDQESHSAAHDDKDGSDNIDDSLKDQGEKKDSKDEGAHDGSGQGGEDDGSGRGGPGGEGDVDDGQGDDENNRRTSIANLISEGDEGAQRLAGAAAAAAAAGRGPFPPPPFQYGYNLQTGYPYPGYPYPGGQGGEGKKDGEGDKGTDEGGPRPPEGYPYPYYPYPGQAPPNAGNYNNYPYPVYGRGGAAAGFGYGYEGYPEDAAPPATGGKRQREPKAGSGGGGNANKKRRGDGLTVVSAERPYPCKFEGCHWAFARLSDQRRHFRSHQKPTFHCPYWASDPTCHRNGGAFNRLDVLKRHLKLVHFVQFKQSDSGWCRVCQKMFPSPKHFVDHCERCAQAARPTEWKVDQVKGQGEGGPREEGEDKSSAGPTAGITLTDQRLNAAADPTLLSMSNVDTELKDKGGVEEDDPQATAQAVVGGAVRSRRGMHNRQTLSQSMQAGSHVGKPHAHDEV